MFTKENCRFTPKDKQIRNIIEDYEKNKINLNPWFQRDFKNKIKSSIVESILLGFPLSRIYLMKYSEDDGKTRYYVIDGKQRLSTIISFYKGVEFDADLNRTNKEFKCSKFKNLKHLNGYTFKDLDENSQDDFMEYQLSIIEVEVLGDVSNNEVLEYIFEKVNTTSKALSKAEIQNCIYSGPLFEKLKSVTNDTYIKQWFGKRISRNDLINFLLQFLCIISDNYDNKNISNSINSMLEKYHKDESFANTWIKNTLRIFKKGVEIFNPELIMKEPRPLLKTYILIAYFKIEDLHPQLIRHKDDLIKRINDMFKTQSWVDASSQWTTKPQNIMKRIALCEHVLEVACQNFNISLDSKRTFDAIVRTTLYVSDKYCKLCNQRIDRIEDAHVDHKIPWSLGGPTTMDNAQLSHRTCNISKSNKL